MNYPTFIMCVPLSFRAEKPDDQVNPTVEQCPKCKCDMWVSDRKRALAQADSNAIMQCGYCLFETMKELGYDPKYSEMIDIAKLQ